MNVTDLRSDTVTQPTAGMKEAMISAPLGDDVYGEDPTTNLFQEEMAALFGMEAGLFVPTGVLANQLALKAWTQPGDEVIVERESHIFNYETAAPALMSGVQLNTVVTRRGVFALDDLVRAIRPPEYYYPKTTLVCIENTHNRFGGTLYGIERIRELQRFCHERSLHLHLDGARIWNAHIATGTTLQAYGEAVDSLSICFSKGLGAPMGSMLLGPRSFIDRAHTFRKIFGGGMRQTGIVAAAAQYAVAHHLAGLAKDHARARGLAEALQRCEAFFVDESRVQTNMVLLDFSTSAISAQKAQKMLEQHGVRIGMGMGNVLRAVTHRDLTDADLHRAIDVFHKLFPSS
ncbi:MAG: aminotransferase class I/II-fold pyridoxal phosphate-dependent enzyme [Bacteroidetes bacterium]|nr:aminotransferase class I/II-fold pyridoxal phosphate-dependent enzyme [Bacteroidota bacterium]